MVHGYLLSGTGSNLYVRNIVKKMCELGQDVVLVCQEFTPEDYDFISKHYKAKGGNYQLIFQRETPYPGKCEVYTPDTNNELLVYVYDRYKDLHVREMKDVSKFDIQNYITNNAKTIQHICESNDIRLTFSNHLVLQPQYVEKGMAAAQCSSKHIIIGHGSDLSYAISQSAYLEGLSRATLATADQLVAVSQHSKQNMQSYYRDLDLASCKVISAGLDERLFEDMPQEEEKALIEAYLDTVDQGQGFSAGQVQMIADMVAANNFDFADVQASYEPKDVEVDVKGRLFDMLYRRDNQKVIFLGKYLEQKGLIPLVLGLPILYARNPQANFILVGFGALRAHLEYLLQLVKLGKMDVIFDRAQALGITLEEDFAILDELKHWLSDPENSVLYQQGARLIDSNTLFTGYLDQRMAARILRRGKVSVFPSIYPEAFGMVTIEAMAAQTKPIVTRHSGFKEVLEVAAAQVPGLNIEDFSVPLDDQLLFSIVDRILALLEGGGEEVIQEMSTFALSTYGWQGITRELLAL